MKVKSLVSIFLSLMCFAMGASEVDYGHKGLTKALKKAGVSDPSSLEEMVLPDSLNALHQVNGKYFLVNDADENPSSYVYVGRVFTHRTGGSGDNADNSSSEYFDYVIFFDKSKAVQSVKVFNYQALHGHEITAKGWLKQFVGYGGEKPLHVDKDVDSISGATISVYAITDDVEVKTKILQNIP